MVIKYLFFWFGMMILAIANGTARELLFAPYLSEQAAHQLSTFTLILLFSGYFRFLTIYRPIPSSRQAWIIGACWLVMTLLFETVIGLISGADINDLLQHYNIFAGNLWIFIPLWTLFGPVIFQRLQHETKTE